MVDRVPLSDPGKGRIVIPFTRSFRRLPDDGGGRTDHVSPSEPLPPGAKADVADPSDPTRSWQTGRRDGQSWLDARS